MCDRRGSSINDATASARGYQQSRNMQHTRQSITLLQFPNLATDCFFRIMSQTTARCVATVRQSCRDLDKSLGERIAPLQRLLRIVSILEFDKRDEMETVRFGFKQRRHGKLGIVSITTEIRRVLFGHMGELLTRSIPEEMLYRRCIKETILNQIRRIRREVSSKLYVLFFCDTFANKINTANPPHRPRYVGVHERVYIKEILRVWNAWNEILELDNANPVREWYKTHGKRWCRGEWTKFVAEQVLSCSCGCKNG